MELKYSDKKILKLKIINIETKFNIKDIDIKFKTKNKHFDKINHSNNKIRN